MNILKFIGAIVGFLGAGFLCLMIIAGCMEGFKRLKSWLQRTRMENIPRPFNNLGSFKHMEFDNSDPDDEETNKPKTQEMISKK